MDPDIIRQRKCKACPAPPAPPPPPSPKKEAPPPPPPHSGNVVKACQHGFCNFHGHPLPPSPSLCPCHPTPQPRSQVRNYWNHDLDPLSRMQRVESLEIGYRMNFRDPWDGFHEDHTLRRCNAGHQRHGPPRMLMGQHRGQPPPVLMGHHCGQPPPILMGHHRGQPPLLLGHQHESPAFYLPPSGDYSYQHGFENPNGCTIM
ncbi:unnamed protein product [Withania somnifera]